MVPMESLWIETIFYDNKSPLLAEIICQEVLTSTFTQAAKAFKTHIKW